MIRLMQRVLDLFKLPPAPPANTARDQARIDREVVSLRSHGNIRLQQGKYYTQEDLRDQYERVRRYDFSD